MTLHTQRPPPKHQVVGARDTRAVFLEATVAQGEVLPALRLFHRVLPRTSIPATVAAADRGGRLLLRYRELIRHRPAAAAALGRKAFPSNAAPHTRPC